jgi:hypothetical protein
MRSHISTLLLITVISIFLSACASKVAFKPSSVVPAAEGSVKVKEGKNGNYIVEVNVLNLASPEKLKPSRKYYVVWVKSKSGTHNLGKLTMEELNGSLNAESTFEPVRIIISAENDNKAAKISKQIVLKSKKI